MGILYAVLTIGILAFILGAALEFASKKFAIKKDERLSELEKIMPGVNCGGCGYAGCSAYASAVASGEAKIGKCAPGGKALALSMATIMGVDEISEPEKQVAFVACRGDVNHTQLDAKYDGAVVEIWRYDPLIFSSDNRSVDSLSLYLSFGGETDPRIRKELEMLQENTKW